MGADEWDAGLERGCWRWEGKERVKEGGPQRARKEGREEECKGEGESRSGLLSVSAGLRPSTEDKKRRCCESSEPWCFFETAAVEAMPMSPESRCFGRKKLFVVVDARPDEPPYGTGSEVRARRQFARPFWRGRACEMISNSFSSLACELSSRSQRKEIGGGNR